MPLARNSVILLIFCHYSAEAGPPKEEEPDQMTYEEYLEKCNNEKKETVFNIRKVTISVQILPTHRDKIRYKFFY